jgi:hypothetical protein
MPVPACAPTVHFTPTTAMLAPRVSRPPETVRVLGLAPQCPYHELGLLDLTAHAGTGMPTDAAALQAEAAKQGADAVVVNGNLDVEGSRERLTAVAITVDGTCEALTAN